MPSREPFFLAVTSQELAEIEQKLRDNMALKMAQSEYLKMFQGQDLLLILLRFLAECYFENIAKQEVINFDELLKLMILKFEKAMGYPEVDVSACFSTIAWFGATPFTMADVRDLIDKIFAEELGAQDPDWMAFGLLGAFIQVAQRRHCILRDFKSNMVLMSCQLLESFIEQADSLMKLRQSIGDRNVQLNILTLLLLPPAQPAQPPMPSPSSSSSSSSRVRPSHFPRAAVTILQQLYTARDGQCNRAESERIVAEHPELHLTATQVHRWFGRKRVQERMRASREAEATSSGASSSG